MTNPQVVKKTPSAPNQIKSIGQLIKSQLTIKQYGQYLAAQKPQGV